MSGQHTSSGCTRNWRATGIGKTLIGLFLLTVCMAPVPVESCTIPVFRYALERWEADKYRLVIRHNGQRSTMQNKPISRLSTLEQSSFIIEWVDVAEQSARGTARPQPSYPASSLPAFQLLSPSGLGLTVRSVWNGSFDLYGITRLRRMIYNPITKKIARLLMHGQSAVWLLVKGSDEGANMRIRNLLDERSGQLKQRLVLPHELDPRDSQYDIGPAPGVPLKVDFSTVEMDPSSPQNALLMNVLSLLDPAFENRSGPQVVPIFGKLRALTVLHGKDLNATNLEKIATFLAGPCSCRIKELHPGIDLPAPLAWDDVIWRKRRTTEIIKVLPGRAIPDK